MKSLLQDMAKAGYKPITSGGQSQSPVSTASSAETKGYMQQATDASQQGVNQITEGYKSAVSDFNQGHLGSALENTAKVGAGVVGVATAGVAPIFKPIGDVTNWLGNKISDIPAVQHALTTTDKNGVVDYSKTGSVLERVINDIANVNTIVGAVAGGKNPSETAGAVSDVASKATNIAEKGTDAVSQGLEIVGKKVSDMKSKVAPPDVSRATKVSLNPIEALKGSGQDIKVSVGGKVKNLSELDINEQTKLKSSTANAMKNFTEQAKKFATDRSTAGGSPVEIVGQRTDSALKFADTKRQVVGQKMGIIEEKYNNVKSPISENTQKAFDQVSPLAEKHTYGIGSANLSTVQKFMSDFQTLVKNGSSVGERNQFIREWQKYIQDSKDSYGNFKDNAHANTKMQSALATLRDETVNIVSSKDEVYAGLRKQYATFKNLDIIGKSLLGKEGALGERIKGSSLVKRAIQSNSDAGARQFLTQLRDLTGYDAIKEGDLALTAMENVGDYQGLSLLNVLKEGKSGVLKKLSEVGENIIAGNKTTRTMRYIKK